MVSKSKMVEPKKTWDELVSMKINALVVISVIHSLAIICLAVAIIFVSLNN